MPLLMSSGWLLANGLKVVNSGLQLIVLKRFLPGIRFVYINHLHIMEDNTHYPGRESHRNCLSGHFIAPNH